MRRHTHMGGSKFISILFLLGAVQSLTILFFHSTAANSTTPASSTVKEQQSETLRQKLAKSKQTIKSLTNQENVSWSNGFIPSDYNGSFDRPAWRCSSSHPSPSLTDKLFFVHIFKTAGSTFRAFFDNYGKKCGKGVSIMKHCSDVDATSLNSQNPDRDWTPSAKSRKQSRVGAELHPCVR